MIRQARGGKMTCDVCQSCSGLIFSPGEISHQIGTALLLSLKALVCMESTGIHLKFQNFEFGAESSY